MSAMAFQITGVLIVCSTVCSGAYQRTHQSSASLALVKGVHRWPVASPHKGPVTQNVSIWWQRHDLIFFYFFPGMTVLVLFLFHCEPNCGLASKIGCVIIHMDSMESNKMTDILRKTFLNAYPMKKTLIDSNFTEFISSGPIDSNSELIQHADWHRTGDKSLPELCNYDPVHCICMHIYIYIYICVPMSHWVKHSVDWHKPHEEWYTMRNENRSIHWALSMQMTLPGRCIVGFMSLVFSWMMNNSRQSLPRVIHHSWKDQTHKSNNASVSYPTAHHSELTCAHFCSECCIVGCATLWDLWDWSDMYSWPRAFELTHWLSPTKIGPRFIPRTVLMWEKIHAYNTRHFVVWIKRTLYIKS